MIGTFEEPPPNHMHGGYLKNIVPSVFPMLQTHFPRWSRVGRLDRSRYPKSVKQDHLSVSHASMTRHNAGQSAKKSKSSFQNLNAIGKSSVSSASSDVSAGELISVNMSQRVLVLEKNIKFLKEKHLEMLSALHQELEKLKQENKELQFQLVMSSCLECSTSILDKDISLQEAKVVVENSEEQKVLPATDNLADNQRILFLEEEIQELRQALHDARTRNYYLASLLEQANKKQEEPPCRSTSNLSLLDLKPTTGPLMVYPKDEAPRPPILQECEVIIRHLQEINEQQDIELCKLKTNLMQCNKLHLHHSDSDNYVERKSKHPQTSSIKLPKIHNKHSPKKGTEPKPIPKEKLMLPALKDPVHCARLTERRRSRPPLIPNPHAKSDS